MLESLFSPHCTSPREWIESNLIFPRQCSPSSPGPISLARQPWMAEILETALDPSVEHIYMVMGTQTGKTTACMLAAALLTEFDPLPLIWALPTDPLAKKMSMTRLAPFFEQNPVLAAHLPGGKITTPLRYDLDGLTAYVTGIMSPAKAASDAAAYIICDEEAKFEHAKKNEAHPVHLLAERLKSFPRHLMIHASTPNVEENIFWRGYLATDRRHLFLPCPKCGEWITLEYSKETVVWPKECNTEADVREHARYRCKCGALLDDSDKMAMLQLGQWRATNPNAPAGRRGYRINSLYSHNVTIGEFASAAWLCQHDPFPRQAWQNFVNSWCAKPWVEYSTRVDDYHIQKKRGEYLRGSMPVSSYYYIVVGYDPGQSFTHWVATAIAPGGDMWVIDYGTLLSVESDTLAGKVGVAAHFSSLSWNGHRPLFGFVDSGDWTETVYRECAKVPGLTPTKGKGAAGINTFGVTPLKAYPALDLVTYSDELAKDELYASIIARGELAELRIPSDAGGEFIRGLSGQVKEKKTSGRAEWKKLPDDHYGDCLKLGRVSWWLHRLTLEPAVYSPPTQTENNA